MAKAIPEKGTMEYGAWNALYHGLKLQPGEKVVVVTDKDQRKSVRSQKVKSRPRYRCKLVVELSQKQIHSYTRDYIAQSQNQLYRLK